MPVELKIHDPIVLPGKLGDVYKLNSGGPEMVIVNGDPTNPSPYHMVTCAWTVNGELKQHDFPYNCLTLVRRISPLDRDQVRPLRPMVPAKIGIEAAK